MDNVAKARELYPKALVTLGAIESIEPFPTDVVVFCEILEHLEDPAKVVMEWLKLAQACVISHPLGEDLDSPTSGGDHQWSYTEEDFNTWFMMGGHQLVERTIFQMGSYRIALGYGVRA